MTGKTQVLNQFGWQHATSYIEKPTSNFSETRNRKILKQVLDENDKMQWGINPIVAKNAGNVGDILASFAKYKLDIGGGKQLEQWLGKSWMTKIYGEKLIEKIRLSEVIRKQNLANGNTIMGGNFYLK